MVTNCVMDAKDIMPAEAMTPDMRMVILSNGDTKFVNGEEYQQLMTAGLILGADK